MFEYFPGNYVWNLSVVAALNSGGLIDEIDRACRPIKDAAAQGSDVGTAQLMASWTAVVDDLEREATEDDKAGHVRSAGAKYFRATNYLVQAERMQSAPTIPVDAPSTSAASTSCRRRSTPLDPTTTRVEVPFEGAMLPAYFTDASAGDGPVPCMVMWNGLDSTKEHMYLSGFPGRARGPWHLDAHGRLPGKRRSSASPRLNVCGRDRAVGRRLRRLPRGQGRRAL